MYYCRSASTGFFFNLRLALAIQIACAIFLSGHVGAQQSASLSWNPPANGVATGYALYLGTSSGVYQHRIDAGTNLLVTITGLPAGATNYFVATAYNSAGVEGPVSVEARFNTSATNVPAPTNVPGFVSLPLRITNNSGRLQISAASTSNLTWLVQTSTNLLAWNNLFTNSANRALSYAPTVSSGQSWHYYRGVAVGGSINSNSVSNAIAAGQLTANAVGYLRLNAIARGNTLFANPFKEGDNTVSTLFPSLPSGVVLYQYTTGAGYTSNTLTTAGWKDPSMTLAPGDGIFLTNPSKNVLKLLFAGEIVEGTVTNSIPVGYSITSAIIPLPTALATLPAKSGDVIQTYSGRWIDYTNISGAWVGNPKSAPLLLNPGSAVFITKYQSASWVQSWSPAE